MDRLRLPRTLPAWLSLVLVVAACASDGQNTDEDVAATTATFATTSTTQPVDPLAAPISNAVFGVEPLESGAAPLVGLVPSPGVDLDRPPLAVKIDNVDAARPQAGINQADMVFEELVEGGLTRLLAIFHSIDPETVGPVRSARSTDVPLLMPFRNPLFSWSGSNAAFAELLDSTAVFDVGVDRRPEAYQRRDERIAPSNLYASPALMRSFTPDSALAPEQRFDFLPIGESVLPAARPVDGVDVQWGSTEVGFRWDSARGGWARTQNGTPHVDETGLQVAPQNLVVQFVPYLDTEAVDSNGAPVPEAQIDSGRGLAWILSGGSVVVGSWSKDNVTIPTVFLGPDGLRVRHARGTTWILLVADETATLVEAPSVRGDG